MSDLDFYPVPSQPKRGLARWLRLLAHAILFALLIFFFPSLRDAGVDILTGNTARIIIPIWAGVLVSQLVIIVVLDIGEGIALARRERRRRQEYDRMKNRRQLLQHFSEERNPTETPEA